MSPLIVGLALCWLLCSLLAGRFAASGLLPSPAAPAILRRTWARFLAGFVLWPLIALLGAAFAIFAFVIFPEAFHGEYMDDDEAPRA